MKSLVLLLLLAAQARAGIISGGSGAGGSSASGISTGAVTTAALTGNGQITSPLGVNSSSVAVFDANRNLALPYGLSASTAVITYVQASSITTTGAVNALGGVVASSASIVANGTGARVKVFNGGVGATLKDDTLTLTAVDVQANVASPGQISLISATNTELRLSNAGGYMDGYVSGTKIFRAGGGFGNFFGIGTTGDPATKLHVSSGVLTLDGAGAGLRFAGGTTQSSTTISHVSGALTANLTTGVTFFSFVPDSAISLRRITTTIQVASVGVGNDVIRCNNAAGTGVEVTSAVAAAAGTSTTAVGSADIAYQGQVFCHYEGGATTKPNLSFALEYVHQ